MSSMNDVFSKKSQSDGQHYLIQESYKIWKSGSIFRIMGNIIYDCDTKAYEIFIGDIPDDWIELTEKIGKDLLTKDISERVSIYSDLYKKKSLLNVTKMNENINNMSNYLLSEPYLNYAPGSIFEVSNNEFFDCDRKDRGTLMIDIPSNWINILQEEKRFLLTKKRIERVSTYKDLVILSPNKNSSNSLTNSPNKIFKKENIVSDSISECMQSDKESKNKYFEMTVIHPNSILDICSIWQIEEWNVGDEVEFRLVLSFTKYNGVIKWIGQINDVNAAVVELASVLPDDPILSYKCSMDVCSRLLVYLVKSSVIVVLSSLKKRSPNNKLIEKHFYKMFASLKDSKTAVEIFNDALTSNDKTFIMRLINECPSSVLVDFSLKMILTTESERNRDVLIELIMKIAKFQNCNLLKIAKTSLLKKKKDIVDLAVEKCTDLNIFLENGETFLTDLLKNNCTEEVVNSVIKMNVFDINKPNKKNETPLSLACGRVMVSTVNLLVDFKCNIEYDKYKAMDIAFAVKKKTTKIEQLKKIDIIIETLGSKPNADSNICTICMDRKICIVFNCGHNCCKECADRLLTCHMCCKTITNKITLYLS